MAKQVGKQFTWVIEDFSLQTEVYFSDPILIGDCQWFLFINPKEDNVNSLYMGLEVADPESLPSGWRRYKKLSFGSSTNVPLTKLLDEKEGFQVDGELMIVAEVEVHQVVGTYDCSEESEEAYESFDILNETQEYIDVNGFQVLPSQVEFARCIFERHPDIAVGFRSKNQLLRKTSMNFLLNLIETLGQSLQDLSSEDLEDADIALTDLKDVGFEVKWLESILDDVKEKKEKEESSLVRLREMDDTLLKLKQKCSDLDALVKEEKAELSATRTPLSYYDVV
ncbi:TRAF-like family protein [Raphanus sativus]|nr:TRAF-like family protein [Raphanus sativus]